MNYINKFSEKAKYYAKNRPGYPMEIVDLLFELGINQNSTIADIGAGTGLLTKILALCGCNILAVEPNQPMMQECQDYCKSEKNVDFVLATAENTTLPDHSIDIITVAQAFHWFNKEACKPEFRRILKPHGYVLLIWLNNQSTPSPFVSEYEDTIALYRDEELDKKYQVDHHAEKIDFFETDYRKVTIPYSKSFSKEDLIGMALSLSYSPKQGDPLYEDYVGKIGKVFDKYNKNGYITIDYITDISICSFK